MSKEKVSADVFEMLKKYAQFNGDNIAHESDLRDTYGIDSITLVEILVGLECEFNISIDSSLLTYDNFSTPGAIVDFVYGKINSAA
jgi:acyl carrier protein